jgi:hypothetical protein
MSGKVGELLILAESKKKAFTVIGEFINANEHFKIKRKHFEMVTKNE